MKKITIRVGSELYAYLKAMAEKYNLPLALVVRQAIIMGIGRRKAS